MAARMHHGSRIEYNCTLHYRDKSCGNRANISETDIEKYLLENIDDQFRALQIKSVEKGAEAAVPSYSAEIAKLRHKLDRLKDLYINDLIEMDAYKRDYENLSAQLDELDRKQSAVDPGPDIHALQDVFIENWGRLYADMTREEQRQFWLMCIKAIQVYPDRGIKFSF
jgi:hypothetical protein